MSQRIHAVFPSWLVALSLVAAFLGERAFGADESMRLAFAGLAGLSLLIAIAVRLKEFTGASPAKKPVALRLVITTVGIGLSLATYALVAVVFTEDNATHERLRGVLWAIWPTLLVVTLFPLVALELAVLPVAFIPIYEHSRINKGVQRALALALFLSCLFLGNYLADRHDKKWELSAGHQAVASELTRSAIRDLTKDVQVIVFYPKANEVAERVETFFEPLVATSSKLTIKRLDHALGGDLAVDTSVSKNGYIAIRHGNVSEKIRIGTKARSARTALRKLDANFLKALIKVTTTKKVAYFTSGHGERPIGSSDKDDKRPSIRGLKRQLEAWQFTVKELSLANGLADKIPEDAGMIFIMGPEKPFMAVEIETLKAATDKGLRMLIALDAVPEGNAVPDLLAALGLSFDPTPLANLKSNAQITRTKADRWSLYSNRVSSHPSVTTMSRNSRRLATVFNQVGALTKLEKDAMPRTKTKMVIHSLDGTFADLDRDYELSSGETKAKFELAAAVVRTSTTAKKSLESRVFVLADVDVLGDKLLKSVEGNVYLLRDIVVWLKKDAEPVTPTITEGDVKIVHKKDEDALFFHGTTFGMPALVLFMGWIANRRRRKS